MSLFRGRPQDAEKLATELKGCIILVDASFDWKIFGPDVQEVSFK